jgi:hypothetical protein
MTVTGTPPTRTATQADDLLEAAMRAGRIPVVPVDEHERVAGGHLYALADGTAVLVRHDGAARVLEPDA